MDGDDGDDVDEYPVLDVQITKRKASDQRRCDTRVADVVAEPLSADNSFHTLAHKPAAAQSQHETSAAVSVGRAVHRYNLAGGASGSVLGVVLTAALATRVGGGEFVPRSQGCH